MKQTTYTEFTPEPRPEHEHLTGYLHLVLYNLRHGLDWELCSLEVQRALQRYQWAKHHLPVPALRDFCGWLLQVRKGGRADDPGNRERKRPVLHKPSAKIRAAVLHEALLWVKNPPPDNFLLSDCFFDVCQWLKKEHKLEVWQVAGVLSDHRKKYRKTVRNGKPGWKLAHANSVV